MSLIVGIVAMLLSSSARSAQQSAVSLATSRAGDLDPTFGVGGIVVSDLGAGEQGASVAIQDDGRIIVAGVSGIPGVFFGQDFLIARFNRDGSLDSTFGSGGKTITDFFGSWDEVNGIAVQRDGKIVAAGFARSSVAPISYVALARYDSDGNLDRSFGSGGKVLTLAPGGVFSIGNAVIVQPDGRIVVAGRSDFVANDDSFVDFALWRYDPNGTLDGSFGTGGFVRTDFFGGFDFATSLVLQPDGKLVAGGLEDHDDTGWNYALARYNPNGSLDTTFGSVGRVSTDFFGFSDFGRALAMQSDGKLVMAGGIQLADERFSFGLARYNPNGSLDSSFGSGGKVTASSLGDFIGNSAVTIQPTGKIVTAGDASLGSGFALARFKIDGSLDVSFDSDGGIITPFPNSTSVSDLALQTDGKIIALGSCFGDLALARYDVNGFDICVEDDGTGNILQFNSTNGDYQFSNCRKAITLGGTGKLTNEPNGCKINLQDNGPIPKRPDRSVLVQVNRCAHTASASIQIFSTGSSFTITDRDITNNTCACR